MTQPQTMFAKIWQSHLICEDSDGRSLLHVSRHFGHDGSWHAFSFLQSRGLTVRHPDQLFTTPDHGVSTLSHNLADIHDADQLRVVKGLDANAKKYGFTVFGLNDPRQGIIHVVGPEQGLTQPGLLIVCGDSHTSTHGALGALSFGIGASEVCHVLATQSIWQRKPKTMRVNIEGSLSEGVSAKDVILAIIRKIGANGAAGHVIEYTGSTIRNMSMEARLTLCNMSIEAGARAGLIAPDETTYAYLKGKPYAPVGADWALAYAYWQSLPSDSDAQFDAEIHVNAAELVPMVTWGNSPEESLPITATVPSTQDYPEQQRESVQATLDYMGLHSGDPLESVAIDIVFIGSCTNGRIEDLRAAAEVAKRGKAVVPALVVPGSSLVKSQAEKEGLDKIFIKAGFQWRESGCSMCVGMNGDLVAAGQRSASTTNRNFRGRQGLGSRTHLMSPAMAAAAALTGHLSDVRRILNGDPA
jgi:3-isopropylmalate/(R)-2-methylmalate dehydratase large subunit